MLFTSSLFLYYFLPIVLLFYFVLLPNNIKIRNYFLLLASLFFYAWGEPIFVFLMILSCIMNWKFGLFIDSGKNKKLNLILMIIFNLSIIFIFKYLNFTTEVLNNLFKTNIQLPHITTPIGISFFTFQAISYVVDIYNKKGIAQKNPMDVALYISLFPQLVAGPIVRYETIAKEIKNRNISLDDFTNGVERFILGLSKKILLANNMAIIADHIFNVKWEFLNFPLAWLGAIAYTFQIYFDFSGYSDMAIGLGRMFGFHFLENFNYPYISKSISEFWRRWHISLGTWFRDYVYIPLGGSQVKKGRIYLNLFIVWFLTGLWHGANWNYILWGIFFFVLICFEKIISFEKRKLFIINYVYTFIFIIIGFIIFRSTSLTNAWLYLTTMFSFKDMTPCPLFNTYIGEYWLWLIMSLLFSFPYIPQLYNKHIYPIKIIHTIIIFTLLFLSAIYLAKGGYNPFIYFNF